MPGLGVPDHVRNAIHQRCRNSVSVEYMVPERCSLASEASGENRNQLLSVAYSLRIGAEFFQIRELLQTEGMAECLPLCVVAYGNYQFSVFAVEGLVWDDARVSRAHPRRLSSCGEVVACEVGQPGDDRVVECYVDIVSSSSDEPTREAGKDCGRSIVACCNIRHRDAHPDRRPALLTSRAHDAAHCESRDIVPGPVPVGPGLPET